jgi:hypothetical protein
MPNKLQLEAGYLAEAENRTSRVLPNPDNSCAIDSPSAGIFRVRGNWYKMPVSCPKTERAEVAAYRTGSR